MKVIKIAVLTGLFAATSSAALAADLSRVFVSSPSPMRDSRASSQGWYLRGTVSYVNHKHPEADVATQSSISDLSRESLKPAAGVGAGLGYRFNANVRADLTLDHTFDARFKGIAPAPAPSATSMMDTGLFQSSTFVVNGYLDFRSALGLTPYVGAGLGVAHNVLSRHVLTTYNPDTGIETSERWAGGDNFSLACTYGRLRVPAVVELHTRSRIPLCQPR